jgi:elongation factor P
MIDSADMKRGLLLDLEGAPWQVMDVTFQTPSARGASTLVKVKIKNLMTSAVLQKTYRTGEMLKEADCEKRTVQYLYKDADGYVFMDQASYEQFTLTAEALGDATGYLTDGLECRSMLYNGEVFNIELPTTVELTVIDTAPSLRNATAQAQTKPATLETGIEILVPPYLSSGERIRVDTRDGRFVSRVND